MSDPDIINWSYAGLAFAGQQVSGDRCVVAPYEGGVLAAVVDGSGHGAEAARSSEVAVSCILENPGEPLREIIQRCHARLRGLRGMAASLAAFDAEKSTLTWLSVGNVTGILIPSHNGAERSRTHLLLRGGIVGANLPGLEPATVPVSPGDTLMLATDGIALGYADAIKLVGPPDVMARQIIEKHATSKDDALIMVVRYVGVPHEQAR